MFHADEPQVPGKKQKMEICMRSLQYSSSLYIPLPCVPYIALVLCREDAE